MDERITVAGPPDPMDKGQWRRSATPSVAVARPFDPAPLMERLRRRVRTDTYRFAVFGDTHHSPAFERIGRRIREMGADFALAAGDLVDLGGGREGPVNYGRLAERSGDFLRALPVWPAVGNHDADSRWDQDVWNGFANFRAFFNLPPHYRFAFRNAEFLALSWMLPDERELDWLRRCLADRRAEHLFVTAHWPLFRPHAVGDEPEAQGRLQGQLRSLLAENGATAHFSGHTHIHYRTVRDGVTYLVSGGAGRELSVLPDLDAALPGDSWIGRRPGDGGYVLHTPAAERTSAEATFFFVMIDVSGAAVRGRLISADGAALEEFSLT